MSEQETPVERIARTVEARLETIDATIAELDTAACVARQIKDELAGILADCKAMQK